MHVDTSPRISLDESLVKAVAPVFSDPASAHIAHAITVFNRANTDSPDTSDGVDLVLMRVAFEALLGASHQAADLQRKLVAHFSSLLPDPPLWSKGELSEAVWRARWTKNVDRPLDAWAQDFCAARNNNAHGPGSGTTAYQPPVWSDANHLLFSNLLFSLAVKVLLDRAGTYHLTDRDRDFAVHLERFLARDLLAYDEAECRIPWSDVFEEIQLLGLARAIWPSTGH